MDRIEIDSRLHRMQDANLRPTPAARAYNVGLLTMAKVFKPAGLTNVHDLQAVLDAVEAALARD